MTQRGLAHFTVLATSPCSSWTRSVWAIWVSFLGDDHRADLVPLHPPGLRRPAHARPGSSATSRTVRTARARIGFWIGSDLSATVAAAAALVLLLAWNYVLVATARVHANSVRAVVAGRDPMAAARRVLEAPGR